MLRFVQKKKQAPGFQMLASSCGEKGIRTLGTQSVQRFSRPPRSTTPASLLAASFGRVFHSAETEGFEPPKPFGLTVFKTAAIDHSAISPLQKYDIFQSVENFPEKKIPICRENIIFAT